MASTSRNKQTNVENEGVHDTQCLQFVAEPKGFPHRQRSQLSLLGLSKGFGLPSIEDLSASTYGAL